MSQPALSRRRSGMLPGALLLVIVGLLLLAYAWVVRPEGRIPWVIFGTGAGGATIGLIGLVGAVFRRPGHATEPESEDAGVRVLSFPPLAEEAPEWSGNPPASTEIAGASEVPPRLGPARLALSTHGDQSMPPAATSPTTAPTPSGTRPEVGVVVPTKVGIRLRGTSRAWGNAAGVETPPADAGENGCSHHRSSGLTTAVPVDEPAAPPPVTRLKLSKSPLPSTAGTSH